MPLVNINHVIAPYKNNPHTTITCLNPMRFRVSLKLVILICPNHSYINVIAKEQTNIPFYHNKFKNKWDLGFQPNLHKEEKCDGFFGWKWREWRRIPWGMGWEQISWFNPSDLLDLGGGFERERGTCAAAEPSVRERKKPLCSVWPPAWPRGLKLLSRVTPNT